MNSSRASGTATLPGQGRRGHFPIRLCFAAPALLLLPGAAWGDGNITAFTNGSGDLVVVGDSESNGVFIGRTGEPNEFLVEGLDWGSGPTTVNGLPFEVLIAVGEHISISLKDGDDRLHFDGQHPGSVSVEGGPGDDWLGIGDPVIAENLDIDGGPGEDRVDIQDSLVEGNLTVRTGPGGDEIIFFFAAIHGDTFIDTGPGGDNLHLDSTPFDGSLTVKTGPGSDELRLFDLFIGNDLRVFLDSGEDFMDITEVSVDGKVRCDGGPGDDTYSDGGNFFGGEARASRFESILVVPEI